MREGKTLMPPVNTMNNYESVQEKVGENKTSEDVLIEKVFQTREESNRSTYLEFLEVKKQEKEQFKEDE